MKNLIIIGASGFGREVLTWVFDHPRNGVDWRVAGFLDSRKDILDGFAKDAAKLPGAVPYEAELQAKYRRDVRIVGDPATYQPQEDDIFLCAVGDPAERRKY